MDLQTLSLFHEKLIFKGLCIESFLFLAASPFLVFLGNGMWFCCVDRRPPWWWWWAIIKDDNQGRVFKWSWSGRNLVIIGFSPKKNRQPLCPFASHITFHLGAVVRRWRTPNSMFALARACQTNLLTTHCHTWLAYFHMIILACILSHRHRMHTCSCKYFALSNLHTIAFCILFCHRNASKQARHMIHSALDIKEAKTKECSSLKETCDLQSKLDQEHQLLKINDVDIEGLRRSIHWSSWDP